MSMCCRLVEWLRLVDARPWQRHRRPPTSGLRWIDVWQSPRLAAFGLPSALVMLWSCDGRIAGYFRARIRADGAIVEY